MRILCAALLVAATVLFSACDQPVVERCDPHNHCVIVTPAPTPLSQAPFFRYPWDSRTIFFLGQRDGCRFYMIKANDEHVFMHCADGQSHSSSAITHSAGKSIITHLEEQ